MEDYRGKDIYCYDLAEVKEKFAKQIISETAYVLNSFDGMKRILEQNLSSVLEDIEKGINEKFKILIDEIDKIILEC